MTGVLDGGVAHRGSKETEGVEDRGKGEEVMREEVT
jgi:hypothetical protein